MTKRATYRFDEEKQEVVKVQPKEQDRKEWEPTEIVTPALYTGQYL